MNVAEWILVVILSVTLFIFLIAGIVLAIKLIKLAEEAQKIVTTGQQIATKADDIVDNVKGMTSVGGIVKTFASHVISNQERRYAEEDAARDVAEEIVTEAADAAAYEEAVKSTRASVEAAERRAAARHTRHAHDARGKGDHARSSRTKK